MKNNLWTKNFTLLIIASSLGAIGGIAGSFALSFLVFDETKSPFASALILAIQAIPYTLVPFIIAPLMDRLPRKTILVFGDLTNGFIYLAMGFWLLFFKFSYIGYLSISIVLACVSAADELAFTSIFPKLISEGAEQKGYSVSSMLYPVLKVLIMPLAAILLDKIGVAFILIFQGLLSIFASITESFINIDESSRKLSEKYTFSTWIFDIKEGFQYIKKEKGLKSIYEYMAVTNGVARGYYPLMVAFFRTAPCFTAAMYSLFSVAEFAGRSLGSILQYKINVPKEKKFGIIFIIYEIYELMDMILLWIPYPFMLINRALCGFLGNNSAVLRNSSVQKYIPSNLRARVNAFIEMFMTLVGSLLTLVVGSLGELLDYRICVTICSFFALVASWVFIWARKKDIKHVYEY